VAIDDRAVTAHVRAEMLQLAETMEQQVVDSALTTAEREPHRRVFRAMIEAARMLTIVNNESGTSSEQFAELMADIVRRCPSIIKEDRLAFEAVARRLPANELRGIRKLVLTARAFA